MDKRSPEDIRKSIKSLVEEAENVSINNEESIEVEGMGILGYLSMIFGMTV